MLKIVNKKVVITLVVVLVLAGGFFYWQNREIKGSPEDYVIKETEEGKIVENKKAGLTIKVPEGWEVDKIELREGWIMLYSPDTEIEWKEEGIVLLPLEKGCTIDSEVVYKKMDFNDIKLDLLYSLSILDIKSQKFENIVISNHSALKNTFDTQKIGPGIVINVPWKDRVYIFNLTFGFDEKEECIQKFNNFLETVSIQ